MLTIDADGHEWRQDISASLLGWLVLGIFVPVRIVV
jgi:hypothetical protein